MKLDVIGAVEACYARAGDDRDWLAGLLESLGLLDDERTAYAQIWRVGADDYRTIECEATGTAETSQLADAERTLRALPPEARRAMLDPSLPVDYLLKRAARFSSALAAQGRSFCRRLGIEDALSIFAIEPNGRTVQIVAGAPLGQPRFGARTLHQLTLFSAHLNSGLRLRSVLFGSSSEAASHRGSDAVIESGGRVVDAWGQAQRKDARQGLAEAVRRMDRARGALRRTDPDEALQLWRGLVDGTWSLVDQCDSDGKRYVLARRNEPGVRDPKALTRRERAVAAFATLGHQNKFIGYLLGLTAGAVSGHLRLAQRKLGLASRAELVQRLAPLIQADPATAVSVLEQRA